MRLEQTDWRDKFVIKGGLLISSLLGIAQRTTMDLDTTVQSLPLDEETIFAALQEVCSVNVGDNIVFELDSIEPIRDADEYGGLRVHLVSNYGRMRTPMKIDVTTGDVITPSEVVYSFPTLFDEGVIRVMAYPVETILAEKYESIVKRGAATTRARDLYDVKKLYDLYAGQLAWGVLREAVAKTAYHRGSSNLLRNYIAVIKEIESSSEIRYIWNAYCRLNSYASNIAISDITEVIRIIGDKLSL